MLNNILQLQPYLGSDCGCGETGRQSAVVAMVTRGCKDFWNATVQKLDCF